MPKIPACWDHQRITQVRVVKGFGCDRHEPLPSLLPSGKHALLWPDCVSPL